MADNHRRYFWKCYVNERRARNLDREESSVHSRLELEHCIRETDYALSRCDTPVTRCQLNFMRGEE